MTDRQASRSTARPLWRRGWRHEVPRHSTGGRVVDHALRLPRRCDRPSLPGVARNRLGLDGRPGGRCGRTPDHHGALVEPTVAATARVGTEPVRAALPRGGRHVAGAGRGHARPVDAGRDDHVRSRRGCAQRCLGTPGLGPAGDARGRPGRRARSSPGAGAAGDLGPDRDDPGTARHPRADRDDRHRRHRRARGRAVDRRRRTRHVVGCACSRGRG
jgi:hypothetical protein